MKAMNKTVDVNKKGPNYWIISFSIIIILSIVLLALYYPSSIRVSADNEILGIENGFASSQFAADIKYPPDMDTDYEKLEAIYSLLEQMRLEHNRQHDIYASDPDKYYGKWLEYIEEYCGKRQLFANK